MATALSVTQGAPSAQATMIFDYIEDHFRRPEGEVDERRGDAQPRQATAAQTVFKTARKVADCTIRGTGAAAEITGKLVVGMGTGAKGGGAVLKGTGTIAEGTGKVVKAAGSSIQRVCGAAKVPGMFIEGIGAMTEGSGTVLKGTGLIAAGAGEAIETAGSAIQRAGHALGSCRIRRL